jgi:hypothetical protein
MKKPNEGNISKEEKFMPVKHGTDYDAIIVTMANNKSIISKSLSTTIL